MGLFVTISMYLLTSYCCMYLLHASSVSLHNYYNAIMYSYVIRIVF